MIADARKAAMQAARKLMYALDVAELDASAFASFEAGINSLTRQISAANHAARHPPCAPRRCVGCTETGGFMGAMKQLLHMRTVSVVAKCGDVLYDANVERECRIVQALETQEVLARACRDSQVRRFPRKHKAQAQRFPLWASHPHWALKPIWIRLPLAIWQTVKQEWTR